MATLLWLSRRALPYPGSHGFYRFFALLAVAALLVQAVPRWQEDILSPLQLVSWGLLFTALFLVIGALVQLRSQGRPGARDDPDLLTFERTGKLVTNGIYGTIRHPMYLSLMLFGWGLFFKQPAALTASLAMLASLFLYITARVEESECRAVFGDDYHDYMQRTRMFIPGLL
jgi:protein-S-isoprenylcysteine O-methyltransferase Ste14